MDLDDLQREFNGISRYQIVCILLICSAKIPSALVYSSGSFLSATPKFRCNLEIDTAENGTSLNETDIKNLVDGSCHRYDYNYSACANRSIACFTAQGQVDSIPCDDGFVYSDEFYDETTVSEWNLVCDRRTLDSLANCLFFAGFFVGSAMSGIITDWYGRKYTFLAFTVLMMLTNVAISFTPWYELYVVLRFLLAAFAIALYLTAFTLGMELIPTSYRVQVSIAMFLYNSTFVLLLPAFAYAFRDWRHWTLLGATFGTPLLALFFFIPESPRWLLLHNRPNEAKKIMEKCFKSEKLKFDEDKWIEVVNTEQKKLEAGSKNEKFSYIDLFRRPMTRIISVNVIFCWFTVSMVNYGLVLNVTSLAALLVGWLVYASLYRERPRFLYYKSPGNPYLNTTLNLLMGMVGNVCASFSHKFGRRRVLSVAYFGAGISCLLSMTLSLIAGEIGALTTASVLMAFIGKMFTTVAFSMVYIVTAETYATCVRATGLGIGSMGARIGAMIMPFTLQLQYQIPWLTQTIFGGLSVVAGFSSLMFPETKGVDYISTLAEAEEFYRENMKKTAKFFG